MWQFISPIISVLYNLDIYVSKKREANNSSWNTQNSILVFFSFIFLVFICTQSPFTVHQLVLGVDRIHHHRRDHDQNLHGRHLVHHCLLLLSVIHKIPIIIQKPLLKSYANTKWDVFKKLCALPWGMLTTILLFGQCSFFKLQISTVIPVYEIKLYNPFWIILSVVYLSPIINLNYEWSWTEVALVQYFHHTMHVFGGAANCFNYLVYKEKSTQTVDPLHIDKTVSTKMLEKVISEKQMQQSTSTKGHTVQFLIYLYLYQQCHLAVVFSLFQKTIVKTSCTDIK